MGLAVCAAIMISKPANKWLKSLIAVAVGALVPAGVILLCLAPSLTQSIEQFLWYLNLSTKEVVPSLQQRLSNLQFAFGWATYWNLGLMLVSLLFLLPLLVKSIMIDKWKGSPDWPISITITGSVFSIAGIILYIRSSMHPYYLVFFTIWPVLALSAFWESKTESERLRSALSVYALVIAICWLPSFTWNVMRSREAVLFWEVLDKRPIVKHLAGEIPQGVDLRGDPKYFIVTRDAGLNFTPLPFYANDSGIDVPAKAWLLLSPAYVNFLKRTRPDYLANRALIFKGAAFDGSMYYREEYFAYGPESSQQKDHIRN